MQHTVIQDQKYLFMAYKIYVFFVTFRFSRDETTYVSQVTYGVIYRTRFCIRIYRVLSQTTFCDSENTRLTPRVSRRAVSANLIPFNGVDFRCLFMLYISTFKPHFLCDLYEPLSFFQTYLKLIPLPFLLLFISFLHLTYTYCTPFCSCKMHVNKSYNSSA